MKTLYYDCGELGWSLYLLGHLNWLIKNKRTNDFSICTYKNRRFLYKHLPVEILSIPFGMSEKIKNFDMDGTHLFDHDKQERINNKFLKELFHHYYGDKYIIHNEYSKFFDESNHETLLSSLNSLMITNEIIGNNKCILIFPRKRIGKFAKRNLPEEFYIELINEISTKYKDIKIISIGLPSSSYKLTNSIGSNNFIDLTGLDSNEMLELVFTILNTGKVITSVGSQSALPKISLLQKVPTFMIGHEKVRHTETDNWMNTKCGFYELKRDYVIDIQDCIDKFISFFEELQYENSI